MSSFLSSLFRRTTMPMVLATLVVATGATLAAEHPVPEGTWCPYRSDRIGSIAALLQGGWLAVESDRSGDGSVVVTSFDLSGPTYRDRFTPVSSGNGRTTFKFKDQTLNYMMSDSSNAKLHLELIPGEPEDVFRRCDLQAEFTALRAPLKAAVLAVSGRYCDRDKKNRHFRIAASDGSNFDTFLTAPDGQIMITTKYTAYAAISDADFTMIIASETSSTLGDMTLKSELIEANKIFVWETGRSASVRVQTFQYIFAFNIPEGTTFERVADVVEWMDSLKNRIEPAARCDP